MTDTPKKLVVDIATGKQEYIDLTAEENARTPPAPPPPPPKLPFG